jgi:hypothetical protein
MHYRLHEERKSARFMRISDGKKLSGGASTVDAVSKVVLDEEERAADAAGGGREVRYQPGCLLPVGEGADSYIGIDVDGIV